MNAPTQLSQVTPAQSGGDAVATAHALLLVGTLRTGTSLAFVDAALARGLDVTLITAPDDVPVGLFPPQVRIVPLAPEYEPVRAWIDANYPQARPRIVTTNERYARLASRLSESLGLPGPDAGKVAHYIAKSNQKRLFESAGIRTPLSQTWLLSELQQRVRDGRLPFPLVAKPVEGLSSFGVALCADARALQDHVDSFVREPGDDQAILVEQFLTGPEYCVEFFDGVYVGAMLKRKAKGTRFIERGYSSELELDDAALAALIEASRRAVAASGLTWGPVHLDCIVHDGEPYIVELNARIAGSFICTIVKDAYGFDIVGALLDKLDRRDVQVPELVRPRHHAHVEFLLDGDPPQWDFSRHGRLHDENLTVTYGPQVIPIRERRGFVYTHHHTPARQP
ncbi:ATP-grasp domain-containing protein [Paraburkholderia bryophila]|uniref:ATP-grasp domain-containing protein n=1 Tax=Paraburkholderia bryophila TaxID=420952 RepID=UPI00234A4249|nr:ATP-grasp domain-containing protein [Paraburkholderia bryophila]WCM22068.1 ATP-grasp domain-containing protein [Paraburkholderia bryophila]